MEHFPGIALIIDELFNLAYLDDVEDPQKLIQQKSFKELKNYFDNNGIPFVTILDTKELDIITTKIQSYSNVRLIVLDLDLNDDGEVGEEDDYLVIFHILKACVNKYGYFFLLINSAHAEKWEDIKKVLPNEISFFSSKGSPVDIYDKQSAESLDKKLNDIKKNNFSLELISEFESAINSARDKAFLGLIDNNKRTWNKIYNQVYAEAGEYANYIISDLLISLIKQYMVGVKYSIPENIDPIDDDIAKKTFTNACYINNTKGVLNGQPIWCGNLYFVKNSGIPQLNYALVITPECDIAQNRFLNYQIVCGYEINESTFPDNYDPNAYNHTIPPIHALKNGKSKGKWKTKDNLKNKANFIEHIYILPFASQTGKSILIDFRDITFITPNRINSFELIKRINDPMITDILDKISGMFNRKGLPPILPSKINPLG